LKKLGYTKIGLMGSSFGGISSIMAASKTNDLFVLTLKSPVSNFEEKEIMTKTKKGQ
jgi:enterochelin esterase-like enzyme